MKHLLARFKQTFSRPAFQAAPGAGRSRLIAPTITLFIAVGALMWIGANDLEWVWLASRLRGDPFLLRLAESMLDGGRPGIADLVVGATLVSALAYGAGFIPGAGEGPGFFQRARPISAYLFAAGWGILVMVAAFRIGWARPWPLVVLDGSHSFVPWYLPGEAGWPANRPWGSFLDLSTAGVSGAITAMFVLRPAWVRQVGILTWMTALMLLGAVAFVGVYSQQSWPSDGVAGALLGWIMARAVAPATGREWRNPGREKPEENKPGGVRTGGVHRPAGPGRRIPWITVLAAGVALAGMGWRWMG